MPNRFDMSNYSSNSFGQQSYVPYNTYGSDTNVILVTSLEEAVMRSTRPNSETVYFHQSLPIFYRVKVEFDGRKAYQEFSYNQSSNTAGAPLTQLDLQPLIARISTLESKILGEAVTNDAKSDG